MFTHKKLIVIMITMILLLAMIGFIANYSTVFACTDYDQQVDYTLYPDYTQYPYSWNEFYMCYGSLINRSETHWSISTSDPSAFVVKTFSGYSYNNYSPYTITNYNAVISVGWLEFRLDRIPCNVTPGEHISIDSPVNGVWGFGNGDAYHVVWETFTSNGSVQIISDVNYPTW